MKQNAVGITTSCSKVAERSSASPAADLPPGEWYARRALQVGGVRVSGVVIAIRGERLALSRTAISTTDASPGAPSDEFLRVFGIDQQGRIALEVWFDVDDMDAAIAELDARYAQLEAEHPRAPLLNAASRAEEHLNVLFGDRRWDDIAALLADDVRVEECRRGFPRESTGQARLMTEVHVIAELGVKTITSDPVAIRGDRLVLSRVRFSGRDVRPDAYRTDMFRLAEIDTDGRVASFMKFDIDDLDTAIAEIDAKYLAGEAAPYAKDWQTVLDALGELNRHELGPILMGLTFDNHRRASFASEDYGRAVEDLWTLVPDARYRIPVVYELDAQGAVFGLVVDAVDTDGAEVQWVGNVSWMFEQSRADMYEADDLDAALARLKESHTQPPRLENAASRVGDRYFEHFAARDWDGLADDLAENLYNEDHRLVVNSGTRHGRDSELATLRAAADLGIAYISSVVVATRGERLVLSHVSGHHQGSEGFVNSMLGVVEINSDNRIAAIVTFEADDIDAAFAELDARYLASEAAPYATRGRPSRGPFPRSTDTPFPLRRRTGLTSTTGEQRRSRPVKSTENIRASWDLTPGSIYIEEVLRLNGLGAVIGYAAQGNSHEGFEAEWRGCTLLMVEGDRVSRCEVFDEIDLDVAIARFDELSRPVHQLKNAASRVSERLNASFAARDWAAMADLLTEDFYGDDRRQVVKVDLHGRDAAIESFRAAAEFGVPDAKASILATRGERLALTRVRYSLSDEEPDAFHVELLQIVEIDGDERVTGLVTLDIDDLDGAIAELDARYVAGEAARTHDTWSVIADAYASVNSRALPTTTADWVIVDHRRAISYTSSDSDALVRSAREITPDFSMHIEAVLRLSDLGAVISRAEHGTSPRFRVRVARDSCRDRPRGSGQSLRSLRRVRPRDCARKVRSVKPTSASAGKRGKPRLRTIPSSLRGP